MFKKFTCVALVILHFVLLGSLYAADVQDTAVTIDVDDAGWISFTVTLIHTGAATDNVASQAIPTYALELEGATMTAYNAFGTTNRDVNLIIQGSNVAKDTLFEAFQTRLEFDDFSPDGGGLEHTAFLDRDFPKVVADASIAATVLSSVAGNVSTSNDSDGTVVEISYVERDQALRCRFIRVVSDGTGSNPATSSTVVVLRFKRKQLPDGRLLPLSTSGYLRDVD